MHQKVDQAREELEHDTEDKVSNGDILLRKLTHMKSTISDWNVKKKKQILELMM